MNRNEQSGHFVFDETPTDPAIIKPPSADSHNQPVNSAEADLYWAHLFKDHAESFFCKQCGEIYDNPGYCFEHGDAHPFQLEPLILENCNRFYAKIRAKNPIEPQH